VETAGSILPWLYGVATNVCRNYSRSQRRHSQALGRLSLADIDAPTADDFVDQLDADRRLGRLLDRLSQLPRTEQDVFVLVCWEELSYAETAQALRIPVGTVRSRLARVRRTLKIVDEQERIDV
jgi:RNA polymerase sigma factor (sigma-70 family)